MKKGIHSSQLPCLLLSRLVTRRSFQRGSWLRGLADRRAYFGALRWHDALRLGSPRSEVLARAGGTHLLSQTEQAPGALRAHPGSPRWLPERPHVGKELSVVRSATLDSCSLCGPFLGTLGGRDSFQKFC